MVGVKECGTQTDGDDWDGLQPGTQLQEAADLSKKLCQGQNAFDQAGEYLIQAHWTLTACDTRAIVHKTHTTSHTSTPQVQILMDVGPGDTKHHTEPVDEEKFCSSKEAFHKITVTSNRVTIHVHEAASLSPSARLARQKEDAKAQRQLAKQQKDAIPTMLASGSPTMAAWAAFYIQRYDLESDRPLLRQWLEGHVHDELMVGWRDPLLENRKESPELQLYRALLAVTDALLSQGGQLSTETLLALHSAAPQQALLLGEQNEAFLWKIFSDDGRLYPKLNAPPDSLRHRDEEQAEEEDAIAGDELAKLRSPHLLAALAHYTFPVHITYTDESAEQREGSSGSLFINTHDFEQLLCLQDKEAGKNQKENEKGPWPPMGMYQLIEAGREQDHCDPDIPLAGPTSYRRIVTSSYIWDFVTLADTRPSPRPALWLSSYARQQQAFSTAVHLTLKNAATDLNPAVHTWLAQQEEAFRSILQDEGQPANIWHIQPDDSYDSLRKLDPSSIPEGIEVIPTPPEPKQE